MRKRSRSDAKPETLDWWLSGSRQIIFHLANKKFHVSLSRKWILAEHCSCGDCPRWGNSIRHEVSEEPNRQIKKKTPKFYTEKMLFKILSAHSFKCTVWHYAWRKLLVSPRAPHTHPRTAARSFTPPRNKLSPSPGGKSPLVHRFPLFLSFPPIFAAIITSNDLFPAM